MNTKTTNILLELVQALGVVGFICGLPQIQALGTWAMTIGPVATSVATYLKHNYNLPDPLVTVTEHVDVNGGKSTTTVTQSSGTANVTNSTNAGVVTQTVTQ